MAGFESEFNKTGFQLDRFGVITGTYNLSRFPNVPCSLFRLKAFPGNVGIISFGDSYATGTTSLWLPFRLSAGEDTGWNVASAFDNFNLNAYYQKGSSGSNDGFAYWIQR